MFFFSSALERTLRLLRLLRTPSSLTWTAGAKNSRRLMEAPLIVKNRDVLVVPTDNETGRRVSSRSRRSSACMECPFCRDHQGSGEALDRVTTEACDITGSLDRVPMSLDPIPPGDLPVASNVAPGLRSSTAACDITGSLDRVPMSLDPIPPGDLPVASSVAPGLRPGTAACDITGSLDRVPMSLDPIPPGDLPVASSVAPGLRPSTAPPHHDGPLKIHNLSVEEYQRFYHQVVDDMLKFKNVHRRRSNSFSLGLVIKHKLWQRLERPLLTETVHEDGLVRVDESYRVGVYPPVYQVDVSGEPWPVRPTKRAKNNQLNSVNKMSK